MSSLCVPFEQLETSRLVLEPIHPSHAAALFPMLQDADLYAFIEERPPSCVEVLEKRYKTWRGFWNEHYAEWWLNWAARLRGKNEYAGWFQATVRPEYALIAYMVFKQYQRRGFAHEACTAIIAHLASYGVERIRATIDPRNQASIAVARSLEMKAVDSDTVDLLFERELLPDPTDRVPYREADTS